MKIRFASSLLLSALLICGCRTASYWAWEKLGVQKRDLLKKDVVAARDDHKAASQQFKDAMTRLKELTGFEGGNLEKTYTALNKDYARSVERATTVTLALSAGQTRLVPALGGGWEISLSDGPPFRWTVRAADGAIMAQGALLIAQPALTLHVARFEPDLQGDE